MAVYDRLTAFCRSRWVYLLFFLLPLFIYYPLFRSGMVLQGGTDLLFGHYPGLLYGHHMLRAGDLGLWNRLIYDGRDFSQSLLNHIYYPLNWPTLLVPDRFVLRFISWQLFFEICACGCLAYAIAGIYLTDPWSRLLVAVTTELGGFMWFNVTTFIGVHLTFVTLISVYFLLTPERRRYLATFVALSFGFAGVMLIGHPGYLCGFGLVLIGVFVAKLFALPPGRDQRIYGAAIIAAGVAAVVLSAFRTMPVFTQLSHEGGGGGWAADYHDSLYYLFSGLIPGAFGLDVSEASAILTIFGGPDRNNQFHTMHYFGVAAFFLGYAGVFGQAGRRTLIMALVTLLLVVTSVGMKPLSDFFYLTIWPITHESMTKYPCYFSILALMVFTLHALETGRLQLSERNIRGFLLIVAGVLALIITYVANLAFFMGLTHWVYFVVALKLLLLCAFALGIGVAWRPKMSSAVFGRATALSLAVFAAIGAGTAYYCSHHHAFLHEWMVLQTFRNYTGTVACAVAVVYAARLLGGRQPAATRDRIIVAVATGVAIVLLLVSVKDGYLTRDGVASTLFTAIWSTGVFFVLSCTVAELFARSVDRRLLTFLLAILTIGDLLFFDRVYEHVNGPPFVALSQMYPDAQGFDPDYDRARWEKAGDQAELLARPDLVVTGNAVVGWSRGGAANAVEAVDGRAETVRIVNRGDDLASVFQDLRPPRAATSVSFGVWVRGDASARPEILLSGAARGGGPLPYDGKGRWQWLSWTIDRPAEKWGTVRPTLGVLGPGSAEFYAPHLVAGPYIKPRASPSGDIAASASLAAAERYRGDDVMDLKQYRINNPSYLVGWPSVLSDIPMIYGLPTYGGEDSDLPADYVKFLGAFDPDPHAQRWYQRAGVVTEIRSERLLDLLGVRYDVPQTYIPHSNKGIILRPNALARLSLFRHFEVIADQDAAIDRLKDPAFDPTTTVILDRDPGWTDGAAERFTPMPYDEVRSDLLDLSYDEAAPTVLLFDDTYSPEWHAKVDGAALPIYRGNVHFMAVSLPPGKHRLTLSFVPLQFYWLAGIGAGGTAALLLLAGYLAATTGRWGRRRYPAGAGPGRPATTLSERNR